VKDGAESEEGEEDNEEVSRGGDDLDKISG